MVYSYSVRIGFLAEIHILCGAGETVYALELKEDYIL